MYLKRMELFGFKSFADRTEMLFEPGIAAIIGPNGCGKSNLVDAVRWALGEQSVKTLRGTRMDEIIFSGSETRKPLNLAEVAITFAGVSKYLNLDYDEITVTRSLYRSGESEYSLNKSPCRLKDITELFLDTGVGKDIYSIIGQGRVEEIISSKPEDRREIFEEAAAILKYKLRKKEAGRRLEETRENLIRVQDLVFELEIQVKPLQAQAEVTRQYRQLKEEASRAEKMLSSYRILSARSQLAGIERQLAAVTDSLAGETISQGIREERLHEIKNREQDQTCRRADLEQKLNRLTREIEQQEGKMRLLIERENRFSELKNQACIRHSQLDASLVGLEEQKEKLEGNRSEKKERFIQEQLNVNLLRQQMADLEKSPLLAEVEDRQQRLFQVRSQLDSMEAAQKELSVQLKRLDQKKEELNQEKEQLSAQSGQFEHRKISIVSRRGQLSSQLAAVETQCREIEKELEPLHKKKAVLLKEEQLHREELRGLESRLQLLQEQETSLNGYYRGVREILKTGNSLPGVIGPVADLLSVEDRYIRALESALGSGLQYIVMTTEEAARQAICFLKAGSRGWATFLPLDTIHALKSGLERYSGWRDLEGTLGTAAELSRVDPAYQKAVDYLLGSVVVCHDLEAASRAARYIRYSCRVVSLEGDMISPGGAIRGGSMPRRNADQPLGRRKEIDALKKEQMALHKKKLSGEEEIKAISNQISAAEDKYGCLKAHCLELGRDLSGLDRDGESLDKEELFLQERKQRVEMLFKQLETEQADINQRFSGLTRQRDTAGTEIKRLQAEVDGKKELYMRGLVEKKEIESALTEALIALNSCREQEQVLTGGIRRITEEAERYLRDKSAAEREIKNNETELAGILEMRGQSAVALEHLQQVFASLIAEQDEHKVQAGLIRSDLAELEEQEKLWRSRVARLEKRERQLALDQTRLQAEANYQQQRFTEIFRTDRLMEPLPEFDPLSCELKLKSLKEDLELMGEVNLGAIEELERLQERINFLNSQQDDLKKGEAALRRVLAEIDQRMEHLFTQTFETISRNMQQVFSELFNGGTVMLKLTDPGNILESGIEIIAQPPGKKLLNISLMSTGEKVLTAVALLFAILRHKPAPFYLLDEIESALDDANLNRFTAYLKRASENAQFVLITHRKRSMEEAGVLYGVTMPEAGVSRLVSLKLDNQAE
jgi:chromosome segregation protein